MTYNEVNQIMKRDAHRLCPIEIAWMLDCIFRRWIHKPKNILQGHIKGGMTVLDVGCGSGLFSIEIADMVGRTGKVIAADLQDGMLEIVRNKLAESNKGIIRLHKCEENRIGISEKADFVLAFYVLHEVPSQEGFFQEIRTILRPEGKALVIEPKFHVSKKEFERSIKTAISTGFKCEKGPRVFMSRTVLLRA